MTKFLSSLAAIGAFFLTETAIAQTLQANKTQLAFGNATEIAPATQQVIISNPLNYSVKVTGIKFFNIYGEPAFSVSNSLPVTIAAGGTQTITVTFSPLHNIAHNSEMVIETDSHGGNLSVDLVGQGKYSKAYYSNSENKSEEQLKTALKTIISSPYTSFGYNTGRDKMYMEIDNWKVNGRGSSVNKIECIYTGRIVTGYTDRTDLFNTYSINAEHTYPQSKFNQAEPMRSDIHHLFPTDEDANNSRSSYPFGIASTPYIADAKNNPSHLGSNFLYEPRDVQKGATARAMLYFVIRYPEPVAGNYEYLTFFAPQESILKTWNKNFTPTAVDKKRNDDIQARQQNRNPFVDYPQLAARINNFVATSTAPASYELYNSPAINYGTIPANTPYTFNYVLVNNGNQTMNFNGATLSNTNILSFPAGTNTTFTIAPGEAYNLQVKLTTASTDSISENLTLQTNIPNRNTVTVPIYANKKLILLPLGTNKPSEIAEFNLFPNPVTNELSVARGNFFGKGKYSLEITDALGRTISKATGNADITNVNVADLKNGVYFLRIGDGEQTLTKKFIKF